MEAPIGSSPMANARFGQKNKITRPRAPHDQRTKWAYIFGAFCPAEGKSAGLVMPYCGTHASLGR